MTRNREETRQRDDITPTPKAPTGFWQSWEQAYGPDDLAALRQAAEVLNDGLPWLSASPEAIRLVALRASFPRHRFGDQQDNRLLRAIYCVIQRRGNAAVDLHEVVDTATGCCWLPEDQPYVSELEGAPEGTVFWMALELHRLLRAGGPPLPKTESELFTYIAKALEHFETYKPVTSDFAVAALQNAFVGLMERTHAWGKKGLPTKGKVIAMAKEHLEREGKVKRSGWTEMLRKAELGWLPEGRAGRPSRGEVDENLKDKQEFLSKQTKLVNEMMGGKWRPLLERAGPVFGGKKLFPQHESERLRESYGRPTLPADDEE